ncbi:MAG: thiamine-phosphate kinase [Magnetococcales bacterium]|nr:thiamine-phosphate kinase [Magnetococcales bacterium]
MTRSGPFSPAADSAQKDLTALGEFGLIERLFATLPQKAPGVTLGIGDDAAIVDIPPGQELLTTTDTLVEGIHFRADCDPYLLGQKSLRVNLSDIAAMGGEPLWYLLSFSAGAQTKLHWVEAFARGLGDAGEAFGLTLIGGDTVGSRGGISLTITLMGLVPKGQAVRRSGAQVGDLIYLSGTIGDAALGYAGKREWFDDEQDWLYLQDRLNRPQPRVELGQLLRERGLAHAMLDVSDGLVADLGHLCKASNMGAEIHTEKLPLSPPVRALLTERGDEILQLILTGGEDYELLFTAPHSARKELAKMATHASISLADVGRMVLDGSGLSLFQSGTPLDVGKGGWRHF